MAQDEGLESEAAGAAGVLLRTLKSGILTITLNRPEVANAITPAQRAQLVDWLVEADRDESVRAVLLMASGAQFCAGADLKALAGDIAQGPSPGATFRLMMHGAQALIAAIQDCGKPVIAVVQGPATGMGALIALACDLVVASDTAWFCLPFVSRGIALDSGGAYLLPRLIGLQRAKQLAFFGDRLSAADAHALGLVNIVCPRAELTQNASALTERLSDAATLAITMTKRLLNASLDGDRAACFLAEALAQDVIGRSDDAREGVAAFLEKRPVRFNGH